MSEVSDLLTAAGNLNPRPVKMERLHAFVRAIVEAWCVLVRVCACVQVCARCNWYPVRRKQSQKGVRVRSSACVRAVTGILSEGSNCKGCARAFIGVCARCNRCNWYHIRMELSVNLSNEPVKSA